MWITEGGDIDLLASGEGADWCYEEEHWVYSSDCSCHYTVWEEVGFQVEDAYGAVVQSVGDFNGDGHGDIVACFKTMRLQLYKFKLKNCHFSFVLGPPELLVVLKITR